MTTSCPALNSFPNQNPVLVTVQNQKELRLSTYDKSQGTSVDLSCASPFKLYGQSKVTCQSDGTWDFSTKPCCDDKDCIGTTNEGLSEQTKILIAVLVSVTAVVIIILCCIVCIISSKIKKRKREERRLYRDDESNSKLGYMLDERAFFPPPYHWHPMAYPFESHRKKLETPGERKRSSVAIFGGSSLGRQNQYSRSFYLDKAEDRRSSEPFKPIEWYTETSQQTERKTSDIETNRNQPLAIMSSEDVYSGKIHRAPSRSVDSDRVKIDRYKPRSVESDYQTRSPEPEVVQSEEYRVSTIEPEYRRKTTESELVRSDVYRISTVEPEYRRRTTEPEYVDSGYFRIEPDSARPDTFRIVRTAEPEKSRSTQYVTRSSEPVKTERLFEIRPVEKQVVKARNSFADNEWNRPLDNVYVSTNKIVQTKKPPLKPPSEPTPNTLYQGHWPARSEMKELKEFNRRALLNGRDPFLWSNVNTNFGFHLDYDK